MQTIFTLNKLSMDFYTDYSSVQYPEIEFKPSRPYVVMVVEIDGNKFALPLRTNIRHDYCYKFKNTGRATNSATGIDLLKKVKLLGTEMNKNDARVYCGVYELPRANIRRYSIRY